MVTVLTLWISVSAATQGHMANEERKDDQPIGRDAEIEYKPEVELPELFSTDFIETNKVHKGEHELERTGKLLKHRLNKIKQCIQIKLRVFITVISYLTYM